MPEVTHPGHHHGDACSVGCGLLRCLVVQDLFDSPLTKLATWRLPAAGFAERLEVFLIGVPASGQE